MCLQLRSGQAELKKLTGVAGGGVKWSLVIWSRSSEERLKIHPGEIARIVRL